MEPALRRKGNGERKRMTIEEIMEDPNMSFMEKVRARVDTNQETQTRLHVMQVSSGCRLKHTSYAKHFKLACLTFAGEQNVHN